MSEAKTIVWSGVHGDEELSLAFHDSLTRRPIDGIDAKIANEKASRRKKRLLKHNMAKAFSYANLRSPDYEVARAAEVLEISEGYENVIDLHNIRGFGGNFAQIDRERGVKPEMLRLLARAGIRTIVVSSGIGLYGHTDNGMLIEMSRDMDPTVLRESLETFANDPSSLPKAPMKDFEWLEFELDGLHEKRLGPKGFREFTKLNLPEELPRLSNEMGRRIIVMAAANSANPEGYFGELATPLTKPLDTSKWPVKHK